MFFFWVSSQDLSSKSRKGEGKTNHNEYRVYDIWLHGGMYIVRYKINMGDSPVLQIWVLAGMVGLQNFPKSETSPVGHLVCSCWFHQKLRWFSMMVTFQNGHNSKTGKRVSDSWELHFFVKMHSNMQPLNFLIIGFSCVNDSCHVQYEYEYRISVRMISGSWIPQTSQQRLSQLGID